MNADGTNGKAQTPEPHVQAVVRSAQRELHELVQRRVAIMKRIGTIKQTLIGLANLFGDSVLGDDLLALLDRKTATRRPGFTRACRLVLMESATPLNTRHICELLQRRFPDVMERHKDPIASVTTVLNRLVDYNEARCSLDTNGRRVWQWATEHEISEGGQPLPSARVPPTIEKRAGLFPPNP
jgi:hypothetical protein